MGYLIVWRTVEERATYEIPDEDARQIAEGTLDPAEYLADSEPDLEADWTEVQGESINGYEAGED